MPTHEVFDQSGALVESSVYEHPLDVENAHLMRDRIRTSDARLLEIRQDAARVANSYGLSTPLDPAQPFQTMTTTAQRDAAVRGLAEAIADLARVVRTLGRMTRDDFSEPG